MPRVSPEAATAKPVITSETPTEATDVEEASAPTKAERPFLVYVEDPAASGEKFDAIQKVLLQDERVAYGAKAFTAVRMSPEDAAADPLLAKVKSVPRFVVVAADYSTATSLEGNTLSAGNVWNAMKAISDKMFAKTLESCVREMKDTILDLDKIEGEKKVLEDKKSRLATKGSEADQKVVDAKLAALDERKQKVLDRQRALWDLKPKSA